MTAFIVIGLLTTVIMIGLGYWSYVLGKRGKTNLIGSIIPGGYFAIRTIFAITLSKGHMNQWLAW